MKTEIIHPRYLSEERVLTYKQKAELFMKQAYSFSVPDVCTAHWGMDNWILFISVHGIWWTYENSLQRMHSLNQKVIDFYTDHGVLK